MAYGKFFLRIIGHSQPNINLDYRDYLGMNVDITLEVPENPINNAWLEEKTLQWTPFDETGFVKFL